MYDCVYSVCLKEMGCCEGCCYGVVVVGMVLFTMFVRRLMSGGLLWVFMVGCVF